LINKEMVDDFTRKNGITLVQHDEISARWMANLIAVEQAIKKVDAKKIISFHSRIRLADEFAKNEPRGVAYHLRDYEVRHVNGGQSSGERGDIIRSFADAQRALLTNARCLTEGINIPAVDMVAFIDPRQSKVDVTQAVGRAMRKPRGPTTKTFGYIVVPVFAGMGETDTVEDAIKSEKFDAVVDVLNALQEHDEELVDIIREIRERKGEGKPFNPRRLNEKVEVLGPRIDLDRLTTSIEVEIADRIGSSWDEWFGLLLRFKSREGHCRVPQFHVEGTSKLGNWVADQRKQVATMPTVRRRQLDDIGFVWDAYESLWDEGLEALKTFKAREGHCKVPIRHIEGAFKLGQWVGVQRTRGESTPVERRQRLDDIGFIWNVLESEWEEAFSALARFEKREGHCRVLNKHVEGTIKLGQWVYAQRRERERMSAGRRQRLDAIGFVWDALENQWQEAFSLLTKFKAREGHCDLPLGHIEGTYNFGQWANVQRRTRETMPADRNQKLDEIGFVWDPLDAAWEKGFAALTKFKAREGHCNVPTTHVEGTFRLGRWIARQRDRKDALTADQRQRLDESGMVWDGFAGAWEDGFAALTKFKARERHCNVPARYAEGTYELGTWVSNQRKSRDTMPADRKQKLDEIGFVWDPLDAAWEKGFAALTKFKAREGHCNVPRPHIEGTLRLGRWIARQRDKKNALSKDHRQRLDAIGFVWDVHDSAWEEGLAALTIFKEREGHCRVPKRHIEVTFKLGAWVRRQRPNRDTMPADRRQRLDKIGFVWRAISGKTSAATGLR
jgi:Helicase associated domain/Helicase conserved C-terminal domain